MSSVSSAAQILDGQKLAITRQKQLKQKVAAADFKPGLAMILVGENPASQIYVKNKAAACQEVGFHSQTIGLPTQVTTQKLVTIIKDLNADPQIHGLLVQLPLPQHLDEKIITATIDPRKDVDGFHPYNMGRLCLMKELVKLDDLLAPCTAKGVLHLLQSATYQLAGKQAVVVGRSNLAGKPIALMLTAGNATVTLCHSQTQNLTALTKKADLLVVAVGRAGFIKAEMVKPGAAVIDVGINHLDGQVLGDVDFEAVKEVAAQITPVPGGVGPMTIACLLENTMLLAKQNQ